MSLMTKREAKKEGRRAGKAAASWKFDGNTTDATYERFLKGWNDCDPMILNEYGPPAWLSGEQAGESMNELLGSCDNKRDEDRLDDVASTYEDAADQAYWDELVRVAMYHVGK